MPEREDYDGFWKKAGCTLAAIAVLAFMALIAMVIYFLVTGM